MGLHMVSGLHAASTARIVHAREAHSFNSTEDPTMRAGLEQHETKLLAEAGALLELRAALEGEAIAWDYASTEFTLRRH